MMGRMGASVAEDSRKRPPPRSRYAVLGMLSWGLESGYEMKKYVESSLGHFWNESYGQIYPVLRKLEEEGLVTCSPDARTGGPRRNRYSLTEEGWRDLRAWLATPVEPPSPTRMELLLKLSFGERVPAEVSIGHVRAHLDLCERSLEQLRMAETIVREQHDLDRDQAYWLFTLGYGTAVREAEVAWCHETLKQLRRMAADQEPEQKREASGGER